MKIVLTDCATVVSGSDLDLSRLEAFGEVTYYGETPAELTAERIKDEFKTGKTIDGAINSGYKQGWGAILDGNVTVVIVSIVLMGAFGPTDTLWSKIVTPLMFMFKSSITGAVYSFGYTLLIGAICNLLIGVALSRLMTKSLAQFRVLRKPWLFGGAKNGK